MIKVKTVEPYSDSEVKDTIVCRGKAILVETNEKPSDNCLNRLISDNGENIFYGIGNKPGYNKDGWKVVKPIVISETEKIELGDKYLDDTNTIRECMTDDEDYWSVRKDYRKILALPEHFSPKQLQAIIDGKLKDNDEVFVECQQVIVTSRGELRSPTIIEKCDYNEIKLNQSNHIKLFPVKQSVEEAAKAYANELSIDDYVIDIMIPSFKAGAEWERNNKS